MNNLLRCPFCNGDLVLSWHGGEDAYLCDCCGVRISLPQASITHLTDIVNRRAQQENRPLTCDGCQDEPYDKNGRYLLGKDNPCYGCRRNSNTKDAYRSKPEEEKQI